MCTLSLGFNNDGRLDSFVRYICDNGPFVARYDEFFDGRDRSIDVSEVDVSMDGIELQDRQFLLAVSDGRELNASIRQVLPCYEILGLLDEHLPHEDQGQAM